MSQSTKINETLEILDRLDDLLLNGRVYMIDVNRQGRELVWERGNLIDGKGRELVFDKTLYRRLEEVGRLIDFTRMCMEDFCGGYPCVPNTPKNTSSGSQQNQGVESPDLDVQKGNVL